MHVAITGASSGIGEALAREYARAGASLSLAARREDRLREIAGELGGNCGVCGVDLSRTDAALGWIDRAEAERGPVEVLINNAGADFVGAALSVPADEALRLLELNLRTPLELCRVVGARMVERGVGTIVNISSLAAVLPMSGRAWYSASKAGLANFSEALRLELAPRGVKVVTVYPGPVATPMADQAAAALGGLRGLEGLLPVGTSRGLACRVRRAVSRGRARVVYPTWYLLPWSFPRISSQLAAWFGPDGASGA